MAQGLVGCWIRLSRNTRNLGTGALGPLGGVNQLSNAWGACASRRAEACGKLVSPPTASSTEPCQSLSPNKRDACCGSPAGQAPCKPGITRVRPSPPSSRAGGWCGELSQARLCQEDVFSHAARSEQGGRKPLASAAPAAQTQARLSCSGAEAAMESKAGGTGEETDLPLLSHGAGPQGKSRGGGPGDHGRRSGCRFRAGGAGSWGGGARPSGFPHRDPSLRRLPLGHDSLPALPPGCFCPSLSPSPSGCASRAGSLSTLQDRMRDGDGCASMGDPSAHRSHQAGEGMDVGAPLCRAH